MKIAILNHSVTGYELRTETRNGRPHWVLPVVMMVEGVHHGSAGPVLYTSEELGRHPNTWDGVPVVVNHPTSEDGEPLSARSPESSSVGTIYNTHMEGDKLKAEAWIDIESLRSTSAEALNYIEEMKALDVSVGVFTDSVIGEGAWGESETYVASATNLRPDHLALLPGAVGACSWDDGCGIRVNKKGGKNDMKKETDAPSKTEMLSSFASIGKGLKDILNTIMVNDDPGFREILTNLQQKLDQLDNDMSVYFLEEMFENDFIYRVHNRSDGNTTFFRRNYVVQEDGSVDFEGEPVRVRKDTSFVTVNKLIRTNNKMKRMKHNASPCTVDALIKNEASQFVEEDREWLTALSQDQLDKMNPIAPEVNKEAEPKKTEAPKVNTDGDAKEEKTIEVNGKNLEETVKGILNSETDPEKFIQKFMPEEMQDSMLAGLKTNREQRENLIEGIVANSSFESTNLEKWGTDDLIKLHTSLVKEEVDYSVNGAGGKNLVSNENELSSGALQMLNLPTDGNK